ncbi:MAG: DMT family transporter [Saccharofermentans sp.]|nr:DMT family transporter [Saccharofermentans sp.]
MLVYGLLKGGREIVKKKCLERSSIVEVLFFYTLIGWILVLLIPGSAKDAMTFDVHFLPLVIVKSFVIFLAWILSFKAIKSMPVSMYGVLDMSRVIFATILGLTVLQESLSVGQMIGLPLVLMGLFMLRLFKSKKSTDDEHIDPRTVVLALFSCLLNSVSGLLDKILMKDMTSSQLQVWYMFFLVLMYGLYLLVSRTKINWKVISRNYWIVLLALMFIIADKALFVANGYPESKVTIMTLIKQSSCFVTILLGKLVYHEKNILKKSLCAAIVLAGILIAIL